MWFGAWLTSAKLTFLPRSTTSRTTDSEYLFGAEFFTEPDTGEKRLYVLDESSLASTRQVHEFVNRLHPNDRVLLVGDRRQHEAVEAGRPFAQLQDAGMKTVKLEEIVRQKDPELKQVVEQLARGEVREAIQNLDRQGRVHEIQGHDERIGAIARDYAKSPENTLVVSPDNRSRAEINQRIHVELQRSGLVSNEERHIRTLVPRQPSPALTAPGPSGMRRAMFCVTPARRRRPASEKESTHRFGGSTFRTTG
jgi:ATP-dependent exoDNAse (exonuclease V) alpha subunit